MQLKYTMDDGNARCLMGWRVQCQAEGRWMAGGYFVLCDDCVKGAGPRRELTRDEARAAAQAMALRRSRRDRREVAL